MPTFRQIISISLWIVLGLLGWAQQGACATAADIGYRFERLWPQLQQPWYFNAPIAIAIAPDGSVYLTDLDSSANYSIHS